MSWKNLAVDYVLLKNILHRMTLQIFAGIYECAPGWFKGMRYLVEGSLDLWGIWMKVVFGMTHWVFINYLGPKNRRRPNLAAAQVTKTIISPFN